MTWLIPVAIGLYFVPTGIMAWKFHPRTNDMFIANVLFGWTGIGWVACLLAAIFTE